MSLGSATTGTVLFQEHSRNGASHFLRKGIRFHGATSRELLEGVFSEPWFSERPITKGNTGDRQTISYNGGEGSYLEVRNLRPAGLPGGLPGLRTGVTARVTWNDGKIVGRLSGAFWRADWAMTLTDNRMEGSVDYVEEFHSRAGRFFGLLPSNPRHKVARGFVRLHVKYALYHVTLPPRIEAARSRAGGVAVRRELDCHPE